MSDVIRGELSPIEDWVEIFPYGVAFGSDPLAEHLGADHMRPVMIFKDKAEKKVLPVWFSQLDAGIALNQSDSLATSGSPHKVALEILQKLEIKLVRCLFTEIRGHHQYIELYFEGKDKIEPMTVRADEALSFCLSSEPEFFCKPDFFDKCRLLDVQLADASSVARSDPKMAVKNRHPYLN